MANVIEPVKIDSIVSEHNRSLESKRDISKWFLDEILTIDFGDYIGRPSSLITMAKEYLTRFLENGWTIFKVERTSETGRWDTSQSTKSTNNTIGVSGSFSSSSQDEWSNGTTVDQSNQSENGDTGSSTSTSGSTSTASSENSSSSSDSSSNTDNRSVSHNDPQHSTESTSSSNYTDARHSKTQNSSVDVNGGSSTTSNSSSGSGYSSSSNSSSGSTDTSSSTSESWNDGYNDSSSTTRETITDGYDQTSDSSSSSNSSTTSSSNSDSNSSSSNSEDVNSNTTSNKTTSVTDNSQRNENGGNSQSSSQVARTNEENDIETTVTENGDAYWATVQRITLRRRRMQPELVLQDMIDSYVNDYNVGITNEDSRFNELVTLYGVMLNRNETEGNAIVNNALDVTNLFDRLYSSLNLSITAANNRAMSFGQEAIEGSIVEIRYKYEALISSTRSKMVGQGTYNGTVWPTIEAGIKRQMEAAIAEAKRAGYKDAIDADVKVLGAKGDVMAQLVNAKNAIASAIDQRKITVIELRNTVMQAMINFIGSREDAYPQIQEISQLASQIGFTVGAAGNVL